MIGLALSLLILSYAIGPATLEDGRCSHCRKAGVTSSVTMSRIGTCTAMHCGSNQYDERGFLRSHPACNTCTYSGKCSNGHDVIQSLRF